MNVASATMIIAMASLLSRLLGMVRNRIFTSFFGAGDELDAYFAAFRIPDLLLNLLILGAFSAAFIPVFTGLISRNKEKKAFEVVNSMVNLMLVAMLVACGMVMIFAPQLMSLITPGFDGEKMKLTIMLTRIMLLSPIFFGISTIASGILNSYRKFFAYAIAPIMYNIGIIGGALFLVPKIGVYGLAVGVVIGACLHMAIQIPTSFTTGYRYRFRWNLKDYYLIKIIKLMLPRAAGLAVSQINLIVVTVIASTLMAGSIAIFNLANDLQNLPVSLFGISFAIAVFPTLAANASLKKMKDFVKNLSYTLRQIIFLIIPASVILFLLRAQIVRVVLGGGKFDWEDTYYTSATLGLFCLGLVGQAVIPLLARAFYAVHNTKTPVLISIFSVILNIGFSLLFVQIMGVVGLALGFSLSSLFNAIMLYVFLYRKLGDLNGHATFVTLFKSLVASLVTGVVMYGVLYTVSNFVNMQTFGGIMIQGGIALMIGLITYFSISWIWGCEEVSAVKRVFKKITGLTNLKFK